MPKNEIKSEELIRALDTKESLSEFLSKPKALLKQDETGKTLLHHWAGDITYRVSNELLINKIDAEALQLIDDDGNTPLHIAVTWWHHSLHIIQIIQPLLKRAEALKIDWSIKNNKGDTVLTAALTNKNFLATEVITPTLFASAPSMDLNALTAELFPPLSLMIISRRFEEAKCLLKYGANPLSYASHSLLKYENSDEFIPSNPLMIVNLNLQHYQKEIDKLEKEIHELANFSRPLFWSVDSTVLYQINNSKDLISQQQPLLKLIFSLQDVKHKLIQSIINYAQKAVDKNEHHDNENLTTSLKLIQSDMECSSSFLASSYLGQLTKKTSETPEQTSPKFA